ncbi:transcriptional regulator [Streptomyces cinnamoneus]|uniref:Transcriptional regulator n=1 Tax=Streptomyces cinnamoneus TaxID=53446 RepID=A0A2G1XCI4_STRCJ|nr:helix-turn-helix transcriptional regulator [Streptomyces cinnamoneus]PHQ48911.1 transcriptional regulator [Streptomyces cinnamoneus]PPT14440.1 XRE family transcriptional regulator [Streptomyces cinnamoneus]
MGGHGQEKVGWEFFGSELKRKREAAGLTQQALGNRVFCSGSYIGQLETAVRKPQLDLAQRIDAELGTDGFFERMCRKLIDSTTNVPYFAPVAHLEGTATEIHVYSPMYVPGLLQTADYARAVFKGGFPLAPDEDIESWVASRLERRSIVAQPTKPLLWNVIDENVIRRPTGGAAVMREQLEYLASLARDERIVLQVLPYSSGAPALSGMLKLMMFDDAPPVAYSEGAMSGSFMDEPARVARLQLAYDFARAAALPRDASLTLIESAAEEYADDN